MTEKTIDILSVGDVNVEITLTNLASMPKLGREILAENAYRTLGGSTVNTAVGCARMGLASAFSPETADFSRMGTATATI